MQDSQIRRSAMDEVEGQPPQEAAQTLGHMAPADIEAVLERIPEGEAIKIASHLPGAVSARQAGAAAGNVAGTIDALVESARAVLESHRTVAEAVAYLVEHEAITDITYIFVVDDEKLVGIVGMRDIVLAKPGQHLAEIMLSEPFAFSAGTDTRDAVRTALAKHYPVYPVVDESRRLIGVVRGWKLFQRVAVEISGQAGAQVGVSREERVSTGLLDAFRMRHPWLQVNLLTAFAAAFVVGLFEDTITQIVALAVFLPVLAGQSGNTGSQALAITLRGITLGQLTDYPVRRILRKEILLGAVNGLFVGVVAGAAMWFYAARSGEAHAMILGLVILIAMVGACIGSGIFGVLVPLTLKRFGADPAMASSIFLSTFTDILGMGLMLLLASAILL